MCGRTYVICTLTLTYFCVSSLFDPVPNFTKQNLLSGLSIITHITLEIHFFSVLNFFLRVQLKLKNLPGFHFIRVSGSGKLMRYLSCKLTQFVLLFQEKKSSLFRMGA